MFILILLALLMKVKAQTSFSYEDQFSWRISNPFCGGHNQSPININTNHVKTKPFLNLKFEGYDKPIKHGIAHNNGHTVAITLNTLRERPFISGSAVDGEKFIFQELHPHWSINDFDGSEHSIDDQKFSAELHLVHFNGKYKSFTEARGHRNGLVVVSVLLGLSLRDNIALSPLTDVLHRIRQFNSTTPIKQRLILDRLLPRKRSVFRYHGSLTTPPCSETVTWFIFPHLIKISPFQLDKLRFLQGEEGPILNNFRQLQPINKRIIERENVNAF